MKVPEQGGKAMNKVMFVLLTAALIGSVAAICQALTPEQVVALKRAGVEDQTIRMMMAQEAQARGGLDRKSVV